MKYKLICVQSIYPFLCVFFFSGKDYDYVNFSIYLRYDDSDTTT